MQYHTTNHPFGIEYRIPKEILSIGNLENERKYGVLSLNLLIIAKSMWEWNSYDGATQRDLTVYFQPIMVEP